MTRLALTAVGTLVVILLFGPPARAAASGDTFSRNLGIELAPDSTTAAALATSLDGFLSEVIAGEFSETYVEPSHLTKHGFFFDGIPDGTSRREDTRFGLPSVLKSYSFDEESYYVTLSFSGTRGADPALYKVIELKAVPFRDHYRFYCLFEERTAGLETKSIGGVTYHYDGELDLEKAKEFVAFKDDFTALTRTTPLELDYYNFESLDQMLKAYGILFDAAKCNFLCNDLGITGDEGRLFVTGMNREDYIRDFLHGHLYYRLPEHDSMYRAFREGMAMYYGGSWGGVTLDEMKDRFREELQARPETQFLEMFRAGRKSSVGPHFSFYFMCGLFFEEILRTREFDQAMQMLYSGRGGETFFANLEETLQVDESNFHETVVRLLGD